MDEIEEIIEGFLNYLSLKKKIEFLPEIVRRLSLRIKKEENTAEVISAIPLTIEEEDRLKAFLKKYFGKDLEIKIKVNPKILGGIIVKVNDLVLDLSLLGEIEKLKKD